MKVIFRFLLLFSLLITSCTNKSKQLEFYNTVLIDLEESADFIHVCQNRTMDNINKLYRNYPESYSDYYNRALRTNVLCDSIYESTNNFRNFMGFAKVYDNFQIIRPLKSDRVDLFCKDENAGQQFFKNLADIKYNLKGCVDKYYKYNFEDDKEIVVLFDRDIINSEDFINRYFKGQNHFESIIQLSVIQQNILLTQSGLLKYNLRSFGNDDRWYKLEAITVLELSYINYGQSLSGMVFLGAFVNRANFTAYFEGKEFQSKDGIVKIENNTNTRGYNIDYGYIKFTRGKFKTQLFPFTIDYYVSD